MDFAKRLKAFRENANLSQKEVAEKCGLTAQAYNNYEKRGYSPTPELLVKFAIALKTTPNDLLDFKTQSISDIEYADNHLDCIVVRKNDVLYEMEPLTDGEIQTIKIPKKDFLKIVHNARSETEYIIELQNDVTRPALFHSYCEKEVFLKHFLAP